MLSLWYDLLCLSETLKTFFRGFFTIARRVIFHSLVHNSGSLLQAYLWSCKSLLHFGSHPVWSLDPDSRSGPDLPCQRLLLLLLRELLLLLLM